MPISNNAWQQVKNITAKDLIRALKRDGWEQERKRGATIGFTKRRNDLSGHDRVVIHFHPKKTYRPKQLKELLSDMGWTDSDLIRLKLIRKPKS